MVHRRGRIKRGSKYAISDGAFVHPKKGIVAARKAAREMSKHMTTHVVKASKRGTKVVATYYKGKRV